MSARDVKALAAALALAWLAAHAAHAFIDPERPVSWLIAECRTIVALRTTAVGKSSATFAVSKVLKGRFETATVTLHWTPLQPPPLDAGAVNTPAVLLVSVNAEDPAVLHLSPEYLNLQPEAGQAGAYAFIRINNLIKGTFNGHAADLIRLLEDTLAGRAYFPVWADTTFAKPQALAELPGSVSALAAGIADSNGQLAILGATAQGVAGYKQVDGIWQRLDWPPQARASFVRLAPLDWRRLPSLLCNSGLFEPRGEQLRADAQVSGRDFAEASFGILPKFSAPVIAAIAGRRAQLFSQAAGGWCDVTAASGLEPFAANVTAISVSTVGRQPSVLLVSGRELRVLHGDPLKEIQTIPLASQEQAAPCNVRLCEAELNNDGIPDLVCAWDGAARIFERHADGSLTEVLDYLGDVRRVFAPLSGLRGILAADFNNDGLVDFIAWSQSHPFILIMNRGYHGFREATSLFGLEPAPQELRDVTALAAADTAGAGALDLVAASGGKLYLLKNTFMQGKPVEANARPRFPLVTVNVEGNLGATVELTDAKGNIVASQAVGSGPVAGVCYLGHLNADLAGLTLKRLDGSRLTQSLDAGAHARPVVFREKRSDK